MSSDSMSALHRIPLPSRRQVQTERERLERKSQHMRSLLRWSAVTMLLYLLLHVAACRYLSVLRISDDALSPALQAGDYALLIRTASVQYGEFLVYSGGAANYVIPREAVQGTVDEQAELLGRLFLRIGEDGKITRLS